MAFPAIGTATGGTSSTTSSTTAVVSIPAGNIGDVVIVSIRNGTNGNISFPAGWVELVDTSPTSNADQYAIAYWIADTTGAHTINVTKVSAKASWTVHRISGGLAPSISAIAEGVGTVPNTASLTPGGGAKDFLWLTYVSDSTESDTAGYPATYTLGRVLFRNGGAGGGGSNMRVRAAARQLNAATEDPAAYTGTATWAGYTVAVPPAPDPTVVTPSPVGINLEVPAGVVSAGVLVSPSPVVLNLAVPAGVLDVAQSVEVTPAPVVLNLEVPAGVLSVGQSVEVSPDPVVLSLAVPAGAVAVGVVVSPDPVPLDLLIPVGAMEAVTLVTPDPVVLNLLTVAGAVEVGARVSPDPVVLDLVVPPGEVAIGVTVAPDPALLTLDVPAGEVQAGVIVAPDPVPLLLGVPDGAVAIGVIVTPDAFAILLEVPVGEVSAETAGETIVEPDPVVLILAVPQGMVITRAPSGLRGTESISFGVTEDATIPAITGSGSEGASGDVGVEWRTWDDQAPWSSGSEDG